MFGKNQSKANYMATALAALVMASPSFSVNVACVGNSITEGYGIWSEKKYPEHLQELLGEGYTATNFGASSMTFANKGAEDNMSYWNREQFKSALASNPDIVVIELGTNDSKFFTDKCIWNDTEKYNYNYGLYAKEKLYTDYEALIDTFAHLPSAPEIFATLQPYSNNCDWGIMDTAIVNQINPIIKETATRKGVNIIDLHSLFKTPEWFLDDSVHPNATGAQELAKIVNKYITMAKPVIKQNGATLQAEGNAYGYLWYKDDKLIDGADKPTLTLNAIGKYKALVKVENDNDTWLSSDELEVTKLGGTTKIKKRTIAKPKVRKLNHKVDVKGRRAD